MTWTGATQASDRDHLCEPTDPGSGMKLVFFDCKHCAQSWILKGGEWEQAVTT